MTARLFAPPDECQKECDDDNSYGPVVRLKISENPRLFCCPHRGSDKWQKLHNRRSSIERWFGLLKEHLFFDKIPGGGSTRLLLM
ncbi:MAG: hypothetical protein K6U04_13145 [Armatimonadetes bacterium]|nr:hypothetical protein [Armatimonadota bacterium]